MKLLFQSMLIFCMTAMANAVLAETHGGLLSADIVTVTVDDGLLSSSDASASNADMLVVTVDANGADLSVIDENSSSMSASSSTCYSSSMVFGDQLTVQIVLGSNETADKWHAILQSATLADRQVDLFYEVVSTTSGDYSATNGCLLRSVAL